MIKNYFIRSFLAHLHPIADSKNGCSTRVLTYIQHFDQINIQGFDYTERFKGRDVHRFEKLNK